MFRKLFEHFTLRDYDVANAEATKTIVRRFTRGNIALKNGLYMTLDAMKALSRDGDRATERLLKKISSRHA
jgi:hypothetical protein